MNGKTKESNEIPHADKSRVFWGGIWSESKKRNRNAKLQGRKLKEENNYQKQECLIITKDVASMQSREIPSWKAQEEMEFRVSALKN